MAIEGGHLYEIYVSGTTWYNNEVGSRGGPIAATAISSVPVGLGQQPITMAIEGGYLTEIYAVGTTWYNNMLPGAIISQAIAAVPMITGGQPITMSIE